ncbi:hypothetical protein PVAP13_8KG363601 [Panicum virgatum]|uniref:Uncharacterized protein n=1 Tax=Panicum virgatum TaxID=38727 RepID=A0A8T0PL64_PANVG|nr:hypothetical protein PVAP13_8KG363601 [Panicum virgatum]
MPSIRRRCHWSPLRLHPTAAPCHRLRADAASHLCLCLRDAPPSPPRQRAPAILHAAGALARARRRSPSRLPAPSASGSCAAPGRPQRDLRADLHTGCPRRPGLRARADVRRRRRSIRCRPSSAPSAAASSAAAASSGAASNARRAADVRPWADVSTSPC